LIGIVRSRVSSAIPSSTESYSVYYHITVSGLNITPVAIYVVPTSYMYYNTTDNRVKLGCTNFNTEHDGGLAPWYDPGILTGSGNGQGVTAELRNVVLSNGGFTCQYFLTGSNGATNIPSLNTQSRIFYYVAVGILN